MDRSRKFTFKERIQIAVIPRLVVWFQKLIGLTSKRINLGGEHFDSLHGANKPWIFAIWHTNVLYSPYLLRDLNTAVMISASRDGEFIESVVRQFGNTSIRGSTSRGGGAALKEMIGHLRKGFSAEIALHLRNPSHRRAPGGAARRRPPQAIACAPF
ncbi:MAG TPA: DUF374 domain-containing protein [Leptospiraceae bacterium]|nr:DUF374 domain-containing protein [Leptospiraceae bacterium]